MNKSMIAGAVIGAAAVTAGGAGALTYYQQANKPVYAEVVSVIAQHKSVQEPREHCENVQVTEQAPVKDQQRIAGTLTGAIVGGVLGHQIGGGSGKKLATVAGAAAGAYAGNKAQQNMQQGNTVTRDEQQCTTRVESRQVLTGYKVDYRIGEQSGSTILEDKPTATRYQVQDGEPRFDQPMQDTSAG